MDLVDEIQLSVALAELIFCIDENKAALCSYFLTACEELAGPVLDDGVVLSADDALLDDLLA